MFRIANIENNLVLKDIEIKNLSNELKLAKKC